MKETPETVLLRAGAHGDPTPFEAEHAKRLLALNGTVWHAVADEVKAPAEASKAKTPPATT